MPYYLLIVFTKSAQQMTCFGLTTVYIQWSL